MIEPRPRPVVVRDATAADLPALVAVARREAVHRDRLADAAAGHLRYLALVVDDALVGFGLLVFGPVPRWPRDMRQQFPKVVDLYVAEPWRGQGLGTRLLTDLEEMARERGYEWLYLAVDPRGNPAAWRFYDRLGYEPLQPTPYRARWSFRDSDGFVHEGEGWQLDLRKPLD